MGADAVNSQVVFDIKTPVNAEGIRSHVARSLAFGLPEADGLPLRTLTVVANGPSARGRQFQGDTLALNGAYRLFAPESPPTYWVACDPQQIVADFLGDVPFASTKHIVASKCHPAVFDRLRDYDTSLWHISDCDVGPLRAVPCAVSVTICALLLFQRLGYRRFEIYGWDCCYGPDGSHHASEDGPIKADDIEVEINGGAKFKTTTTWAAEINDIMGVLPVLEWTGAEVNIHGEGMVAAIRRGLKSAA